MHLSLTIDSMIPLWIDVFVLVAAGDSVLRSRIQGRTPRGQNGDIPTGSRLWKLVQCSVQRPDLWVLDGRATVHVQIVRIPQGQRRSMERCGWLFGGLPILPNVPDEARRLAQSGGRRNLAGIHCFCEFALMAHLSRWMACSITGVLRM